MRIWKHEFSLDGLNAMSANTMVSYLDIQFTEAGDDYLVALMPVSHKTVQPMRILHGGASVVLAETVGSVASNLCIDDFSTTQVVGLDINANHIRSVAEGAQVHAKVTPLHLGRTTHVWSIRIHDESDRLVCVSRLTMAVITRES